MSVCVIGQMLRSLVEQSSKVPGTQQAIEAELRGELEGSLKIYDTLLQQLDSGKEFAEGPPAYVTVVCEFAVAFHLLAVSL